jgi:hypothetical protein
MSSASIFRRSTNQPAIPNRRACAKQEEILLTLGDNDLANDKWMSKASAESQAWNSVAAPGKSC